MDEFKYGVESVENVANVVKKDLAKLPRVKKFRVESNGVSGKVGECKTAWRVMVLCRGAEGNYENATHVAAVHGMKVKKTFKTKEEAIAWGIDAMKTWGHASEKKAKKIAEAVNSADESDLIAALAAKLGITVEQMAARVKLCA